MNFPDPCSAVAEAAELGCVIDHLRDVVFRVDALGCWRFLNRAWTELTGHGLADSLGSAFLRYVHPLDRDGVEALFQRFMAQAHKPCSQRLRLLRRDGSIVWVEASLRQVRDAQGRPLGITGTLADVGERLRTEERLRLSATVFNGAGEGIAVTDPHGRIVDVNAAFEAITGYRREQVLGRNPSILSSGRHDKAFYQAMWVELVDKGAWSGEIWNRRADGALLAELLRITAVRDAQGRHTHYVAIFSDITGLKRQQETLERLAHYDALTGLPNRVLLTDRLEQHIAQAARRREQLAVCYLDLDGFKDVNDAWGHAAGDELLVQAAERMRQVLRATDTVARLGGDEFVLLLDQAASEAEVSQVAERVLEALATPYLLDRCSARVTTSVGIALYPQHGHTPGHLLRNADQAMLRAKRLGKNHACFVTEAEMGVSEHERHAQALRQAMHAGELMLVYQPKVDARTRQPVGVEALLRWQHPERGLLSPGDFLVQVQGLELECEIDAWVLEQGVAQLGRWAREGVGLSLSINLSAATLLQPRLQQRVAELVAEHAVPPGRLELEVLETAALADLSAVVRTMEGCARAGVSFSLDDFGTGYSSLHYLRQLPVKTVKIDQGFVRRMLTDAGDMHIVRAVIGLAGAFGVRTVAEGVETASCAQALTELGCDALQGYGIARPMPAPALAQWLAARGEGA